VDNIKNKSVDELKIAEGMNLRAAESVYNYFHKNKSEQ